MRRVLQLHQRGKVKTGRAAAQAKNVHELSIGWLIPG
jgi:hypothetical protein